MAKFICQSCSMPVNEAQLVGTEKDGTKSGKYCLYCYQRGKFTNADMTVGQMQDLVVRVLCDDKHWPRLAAKFASRKVPKLERWRA